MSEALDQARGAMRLKRPELPVTGDAAVDALVRELGRPLSPNERFNVEQGLPPDHVPPPVEPEADPLQTRPDEFPEDALRRRADALAAQKADAS